MEIVHDKYNATYGVTKTIGKGSVSIVRATRRAMVYLLLAMVLMPCGCNGPERASVTGKVTAAGLPIVRGTVFYIPDKSKDIRGKTALGNIGPNGNYVLQTPGEGEGVVVGDYVVLVSGHAVHDEEGIPPNRQVPIRYGTASQSDLTAKVLPGPNEINFNLQ